MESEMLDWWESSGLHICQHGVCYESEGRNRPLTSIDKSSSAIDIGIAVRNHYYQKCKRSGSQYKNLPFSLMDLGKFLKNASSSNGCNSWCSVSTEEALLYSCGCIGLQPKRSDNFMDHISAKRSENKCRWSVFGKSLKEKISITASALMECRVRCVRASCGHWIVQSPDVNDLSLLPQIIKRAASSALKFHRTGKVAEDFPTNNGNAEAQADIETDSSKALTYDDTSIQESSEAMDPTEVQVESAAKVQVEPDAFVPTCTNEKQAKPTILLFGFTHRIETNGTDPAYEDLLDEARSYQNMQDELPGAVRDKARIVRLRQFGFDTYSVSLSNKDNNDDKHHYRGDFCARGFADELEKALKDAGKCHPVQICVDWYYCPTNWDTSRYLKTSFFTKTLPKIASLLSIVPVALDQDNRPICTRKQKRQEDLIPSGVVFIPFTLGIVTELFKAISVVEDSYEISFLEREQLMIEHPMFAATTSIPDDEMKLFNKNPRPEDGYAGDLFKNIDGVGSAANNVDVGSLKVYVSNNCPEGTRMIKLTVKTDSI